MLASGCPAGAGDVARVHGARSVGRDGARALVKAVGGHGRAWLVRDGDGDGRRGRVACDVASARGNGVRPVGDGTGVPADAVRRRGVLVIEAFAVDEKSDTCERLI